MGDLAGGASLDFPAGGQVRPLRILRRRCRRRVLRRSRIFRIFRFFLRMRYFFFFLYPFFLLPLS